MIINHFISEFARCRQVNHFCYVNIVDILKQNKVKLHRKPHFKDKHSNMFISKAGFI